MMTAPHFAAMAEIFNAMYRDSYAVTVGDVAIPGLCKAGKEADFVNFRLMVSASATYFEEDNPRFNRDRFIRAVYR
jgi:hypothetical protein